MTGGNVATAQNKAMILPETIHPDAESLRILDGTKRKIGMIRLWPEQAAAEHESIERYRFASSLLGVEIVELDRLGFILNGPRRRVTREDVDFVISLHFETPKSYDCFSWGALWNPIDFYVDWGFDTFVDHQFSHDGYFTCGSRPIERMAQRELGADFARTPMANVNHTLSGPIYRASERDDRRLVYCGINWERLSNKPGRFDHLLKPLDDENILDVFGPRMVQNVEVWEGFKGYKREVPFDGKSLIGEIAQSGAVLALSSNAHLRSGVMTSRLFEGAAAGALVFADGNSFVAKNFAAETVPIEISGDADRDASGISAALAHYNAHPEEAFKLAAALQNKYIDGFMMHNQLLGAYAAFKKYQEERASALANQRPAVGYVILWIDRSQKFPTELIESIDRQSCGTAHIRLITTMKKAGDTIVLPTVSEDTDLQVVVCDDAYDKPNSVGALALNAVEALPAAVQYVALLEPGAELFSDFAATMVAAAASAKAGAVASVLCRHYNPVDYHFSGTEYIDYWRTRPTNSKKQLCAANVLFSRSWLASNAGAIQMVGLDGLIDLSEQYRSDFAMVNQPLVWLDLKIRERDHRLKQTPYSSDQVFTGRYGKARAQQIAASPSQVPPTGHGDPQAFFSRIATRHAAKTGFLHNFRSKWVLSRARAAARAQQWSAAEQLYLQLVLWDGTRPNLWKQLGHALKEQGRKSEARFCYGIVQELAPDDVDNRIHYDSLEAKA